MAALGHCGFIGDYEPSALKKLKPDNPTFAQQESLAQTFGLLTDKVLQFRCSSGIWYSCKYPGKLAGLLVPGMEAAFMQEFKFDVEVYHTAKKHPSAAVRHLVAHMGFETPFMAWAISFAMTTGFERMPWQLREMVEKTYSGLGHSRIIEEANKLLRDTETRENPNNTVGFMRMWSTLKSSALLQSEKRDEVEAIGQCQLPAMSSMAKLFRPLIPRGDDLNPEETAMQEMHKKIDQLGGKVQWDKFTPQSEQGHIAQFEACRHMRRANEWHLVDSLWRAALIPERALIVDKRSNTKFFCVRAFPSAILTWRAKQRQVGGKGISLHVMCPSLVSLGPSFLLCELPS